MSWNDWKVSATTLVLPSSLPPEETPKARIRKCRRRKRWESREGRPEGWGCSGSWRGQRLGLLRLHGGRQQWHWKDQVLPDVDGDDVVLPDDPHEEVEVGAEVNGEGSKGQKGRKTSLENEQFICNLSYVAKWRHCPNIFNVFENTFLGRWKRQKWGRGRREQAPENIVFVNPRLNLEIFENPNCSPGKAGGRAQSIHGQGSDQSLGRARGVPDQIIMITRVMVVSNVFGTCNTSCWSQELDDQPHYGSTKLLAEGRLIQTTCCQW